MDAKNIGALIASLRRQGGLTQAELAARLGVTGKAVSRWESGNGFPDVTLFPELASILGVTVDRLMRGARQGIAFAGNLIVDQVKTINCYPERGLLAEIAECKRSVGGCVPNTAIDLAKLDPSIPISAFGRIGDDENGRYILSRLGRYGIDHSSIAVSEHTETSFCDVMSLPSGERTFFHSRGANAAFSPSDIPPSALTCRILHLGYLTLLDAFDAPDPAFGTAAARFLAKARAAGVKTSIDLVSRSEAGYREQVIPALAHTDYAMMNELESGAISGIPPYLPSGKLSATHIERTAQAIADLGVHEKVIIHAKNAAFCLDVKSRRFTAIPSLDIPSELIRGSVGAGDAFCAGALLGLYRNDKDEHLLEFASSVAAASLFSENSVDGVCSESEIINLTKQFRRKTQ